MPDPTIPTIVEAIRRQKPGLLPEWFRCSYLVECDIAVIEAALWRAYFDHTEGAGALRKYDQWYAWYGEEKERRFDNSPLALILALCWAMGIELENQ